MPIVNYTLFDDKEAKASEAPASSVPRMSENTYCPISLIKPYK